MNLETSPELDIPMVWVVIPTWNRKWDLLEAMQSLMKSDYLKVKIVVVDNASTDGTVEAIKSEYPFANIISLPKNLGAAVASNRGFTFALNNGADYILRMDSDIVISSDAISKMVSYAQKHPEVGIVSPKILRFDNPQVIWSIGNLYHPFLLIAGGKTHNLPDPNLDASLERTYVASAAILIDCSSINKVGLLDERFFVYGEDTDWCLRYRLNGYKVHYLPTAQAFHKIGTETTSKFSSYHQFRGLTIFYMKHSTGLQRIFLSLYVYFYALMRATFRKPIVIFHSALSGIRDGFRVMRQ